MNKTTRTSYAVHELNKGGRFRASLAEFEPKDQSPASLDLAHHQARTAFLKHQARGRRVRLVRYVTTKETLWETDL